MNARTVAAVGIFAALAYVGSLALMVIPNATLSILIVFFAGYCTGVVAGSLCGAIAAALISLFNPYGMVMLPLLVSQMLGYVLIGALGGVLRGRLGTGVTVTRILLMILLGVVTALLYQIPVSLTDAWLFGPFLERLVMSISFALVTVTSNVIFFVVLFPVLAKLQKVTMFRV